MIEMKRIKIKVLEDFLISLFQSCGMTNENTRTVTEVFMRAAYRGVQHHDITMLQSRVEALQTCRNAVNPEYKKIYSYQAMEAWDAGNGLGELGCSYGMDRAKSLADQYGIGLCALRNTNHFLAASPYVEKAAEEGYIAILLCKGGVSMGAPGRQGRCISQLPFGFAYPTEEEYPVMLDACMAYASMGQLQLKCERDESIPPWWGLDENGNASVKPEDLLKGTRFPIGSHKGFGLAMLGEALTGVLSNGCIMDETKTPDGMTNPSSHTAIAIKADAFFDLDIFKNRAGQIHSSIEKLSPGVHIPGQGNYSMKMKILKRGYLELKEEVSDTLYSYSRRLHIPLEFI